MLIKYGKKVSVVMLLVAFLVLIPIAASAGNVVNLSDTSISFTEGDAAVYVDTGVTVTSSTSFDDGYIRFSVADSNSGDNFSLTSNANPTADGAISFSGDTVYLGDGSSKTAIGVIDSTEDGQNGHTLKINLNSPMANSGFEDGSTGWTFNNSVYNISGDTYRDGTFSSTITSETDGNHYLHLAISGHVSTGYGTAHGPSATSSYFEASPGDTIAFDWKAARTSDYYDVYAYLVNDSTGTVQQILYQRGTSISSWQTKEIYLSSSYLSAYSDKLKFVFVCGSYDATGGLAIGSTMDIDNIRVVKTYATASVVQTIIRQVKYQNTSDDPAATRTITVQTCDANNSTDSDIRTVNITPVNDAPAIGTNAGLTLNEGASATITSVKLNEADPDDSGTGCIYTITNNTDNGTIKKSGVALGVNGTFTQSDIDNGYITYSHDGSETTSDAFSFTLADGGEDGAGTVSGTFSISVTPVNDAPTVHANQTLSVDEGGSGTITSSLLAASDVDNALTSLTYKVTSLPAHGTLKKSGVALGVNGTFTQSDINSGIVTYVHDGSETTTDAFSFTLSDGSASINGTFNISVTPVNDAPVIGTNAGLTLSEGTSGAITTAKLNEADPDDSGAGCVYTVVTAPAHGMLKKSGVALGVNGTFTQSDIDNGYITYTHGGSETTADSFAFTLADGGEDGVSAVSGTFSISVTPVNDAPVLDTNEGMTLDEGASETITSAMLSASDADDDVNGYGYSVTDAPDHGSLKKSGVALGVGGTFTQADIDAGNITYTHDGSDTTSDSFGFRIADGGENSAQPVTGTFSITVTPVNDAPVIGTNTGVTLNEGASMIITSSMLCEADPDDSGTGCVYTVVTVPAHGTLKKSGVALGVNGTFTQSDIDNGYITYTHDGGETTTDSFAFTLADGGEDGVGTASGTFSISVTPVNDAPVVSDGTFDVDENAEAGTVVGTVSVTDAENDALAFVILSGNTDGAFAIDASSGQITVAGEIDHDTIQQYVLSVRVSETETTEKYTDTVTITVDVNNLHDKPFTPAAADLMAASDTGVSDTDNITNDTTPTFEGAAGSAMVGSTLKLYADSTLVGQATVNADGSWQVTASELADGTYTVTVTSTDNGGDVSEVSDSITLTVDTAAPLPDSAPYLAAGGSTTDDRTPEIAGSSEAYAKVRIYDETNKFYGSADADSDGNWSFTVADADALSVGEHTFYYTLTDYAGNVSEKSPGMRFIVNDPPTAADATVTTDEDTTYVFEADDWNYTDLNDDAMAEVVIETLPVNGTLRIYDSAEGVWKDAAAGQRIAAADIAAGYLHFVPVPDKNGVGYAVFEFKVYDGIDLSRESYDMTVDVTPVNDVHTLTGLEGDTISYLEDQGQALIDTKADADVEDIDNINYNGGSLTAEVTEGGTVSEDVLALKVGSTVTLSAGMTAGSQVMVSGVVVGTVDTVYTGVGKMLKINLNENSTLENVETLIHALTYENSNHTNPSRTARTITVTLNDRDGLYADQSVTVTVRRTEPATVETTGISGISISGFTAAGNVTNNGRAAVTECGVIYSTKSGFDPSMEGTAVAGSWTSSTAFSATVSGLREGTTYYYVVYATNSEGTSYSAVRKMTTYTSSDKDGDGQLDNPNADSDGDGVSDGDEQAAGSDPDDASSKPSDKDGDGQPDSPNADSDGDGVSDADEIAAGSNPDDASSTPSDKDGDGQIDDKEADSDGDGISDGDELAAGSDPDDPTSLPAGQVPKLQSAPANAPSVPQGGAVSGMSAGSSTAGNTSTTISLNWDDVDGADYYLVWDTSVDPPELLGIIRNGSACVISGLDPGREYTFTIAAYSQSGSDVSGSDTLLGAATVTASTYGEDGLPLDDIMGQVTGGSPSSQGGNRIDLTGQVTDENGLPLAGLTVELHSDPRTCVTDSNGWYYFEDVEEGMHTVTVYYGDTATEALVDLSIDRDSKVEGIETVYGDDGSVVFRINSKTATLVLSLAMDEEGNVGVSRLEAQSVVYLSAEALAAQHTGTLILILGIVFAGVAGIVIFFLILFKRRKKDEEEEQPVQA